MGGTIGGGGSALRGWVGRRVAGSLAGAVRGSSCRAGAVGGAGHQSTGAARGRVAGAGRGAGLPIRLVPSRPPSPGWVNRAVVLARGGGGGELAQLRPDPAEARSSGQLRAAPAAQLGHRVAAAANAGKRRRGLVPSPPRPAASGQVAALEKRYR